MNSLLLILFFTAGDDKSTESKIREKHNMYTASSPKFNCGLQLTNLRENFSSSNDKYEFLSLGASIFEKNRLKAVGKN